MGARFAKWRAVIHISDTLPSHACISANAHALARYAALCQEQNLVPIVEPEVLMDGSHSIERCEEVTGAVLHAVFSALHDQRVWLERMLLKPNMVIAGKDWPHPASVQEVATATCAACVATSPRQCRASCSCRAARTIGRLRSIWTQSIDCPGPSHGRSVFPMAARFRTTRWRRGMAGTRIGGGSASAVPTRPLQQCGQSRQVHRSDGGDAGRRRQSAASPRMARRLIEATSKLS